MTTPLPLAAELQNATIPERFLIRDATATKAQQAEIRALAKAKRALILAHNYQLPEVIEVADIVGDSLYLAQESRKADCETIVFCGVHFMAESAKILNPSRRVLLPSLSAGCALADSISPESLQEWKARFPGHTVVTYINSSAEIKAMSDVVCTSGNAVSVVKAQKNDRILFTPDRNLGAWVKKQVPGKEIVVYDGCCPTHDVLRGASVKKSKDLFPGAVVIAHPECREDVLALADEICSTAGMFQAVERHPDAKSFIVATEWALIDKLKRTFPGREFVVADGCIGCRLHCPYMKMNDLDAVKRALVENVFEIKVPDDVAAGARRALDAMLAIPRDR